MSKMIFIFICSYIGHSDLLSHIAIAENETRARVQFNMLKKMFHPCGPPPQKPKWMDM